MPSSPSSGLITLLGERGPCPVCDEFDCSHEFYGDHLYRFGDPMSKHPKNINPPPDPAINRRKGETQAAYEQRMKRLREDRAHRLGEDRSA